MLNTTAISLGAGTGIVLASAAIGSETLFTAQTVGAIFLATVSVAGLLRRQEKRFDAAIRKQNREWRLVVIIFQEVFKGNPEMMEMLRLEQAEVDPSQEEHQ